METNELKKVIEVLLFISGKSVSKEKLAEIAGVSRAQIEETVTALKQEWNSNHGFFIENIGAGFQISTRPEYSGYILKLFPWKGSLKLSPASAEVLSIVLYKQPITKAEINAIRGVDSQGVISNLLKNSLIKYGGHKKTPGQPRLLRINDTFYHVFGIKDSADVPSWEELGEEQ